MANGPHAWTLLSGILETAVEYGYLTVNPARGVKFPPQKLRDAPAMIAGDDFTKLLNEAGEPYRMMIGLIAATGLRIGELLALRWRNLDLTIGTLSVRESVFEGKTQQPKDAEGTTDDSARGACDRAAEGPSRSIDA